jgi:type IX secretion system PorP/SprF family membrane protein
MRAFQTFLHCATVLLLWNSIAFAQDIHFSHLNRQPIYQNPANTGLFRGDIRLTANYKDQWRSVTVPFQTVALAADMRWKYGLNFGALFFHDNVGDGFFQTIEALTSVSKIFKLSTDSTHSISAGIQMGLNYRKMNMDKYYYDNQFNGLIFDPTMASNESFQNDSRANFQSAIGLVYNFRYDKRNDLKVGLSLHNINRPNQGFYGTKVPREMRFSMYSILEHRLRNDLVLLPGIGLNLQGKYKELILGSQLRYILIDKLGKYRAVDGGLWFRSKDALVVRVGFAMQNWSVAVSYDTNISKLVRASTARGGLEISAEYIITRFKPKKVLHRVCPDYI